MQNIWKVLNLNLDWFFATWHFVATFHLCNVGPKCYQIGRIGFYMQCAQVRRKDGATMRGEVSDLGGMSSIPCSTASLLWDFWHVSPYLSSLSVYLTTEGVVRISTFIIVRHSDTMLMGAIQVPQVGVHCYTSWKAVENWGLKILFCICSYFKATFKKDLKYLAKYKLAFFFKELWHQRSTAQRPSHDLVSRCV